MWQTGQYGNCQQPSTCKQQLSQPLNLFQSQSPHTHHGLHQIMDLTNYSTLSKVVGVIAPVLWFASNIKNKLIWETRPAAELNEAKMKWVKDFWQQVYYKWIYWHSFSSISFYGSRGAEGTTVIKEPDVILVQTRSRVEVHTKTCSLVQWLVGMPDWFNQNYFEEDIRQNPCMTDCTRDSSCWNRSCLKWPILDSPDVSSSY